MIVLRKPLQAQSRWPALIDRQNQLGAKVITYFPLSSEVPRGTKAEVVVPGTGGTYVATIKGRGLNASGAAGAASIALDLSAYSAISIGCWFYWPVYANTDLLLMEFTANFNTTLTSAGAFIVDPDESGGGFFQAAFRDNAVASQGYSGIDATRPSAAVWHRLLFTIDMTVNTALGNLYIDGVSTGSAHTYVSPYSAGSDKFGNSTLYLLSRANASLFAPAGAQIQDLTIYRGVLSAAEARQDYQNPYQILQPTTRVLLDELGILLPQACL